MNVSRVDHNLQLHRQERIQLQDRREEDYRKVVEKRNFLIESWQNELRGTFDWV